MKKIILVLSILMLTSLACSFTVNLPEMTVGETKTLTIDEGLPTGTDPMRLTVEMGAGSLNINGGSDRLVSGSINYNVENWVPSVTRSGNNIDIAQTRTGNLGTPNKKIINKWDLSLGNYPFDMTINAGAYEGTLNLGGIPLTELRINDGASKADVTFDTLNPVRMKTLTYKTGASSINLSGLANANFETMIFEGGTGNYELDFSGALQTDTTVRITAGLSNIRILVPLDTPCQVIVTGGLSNISPRGTWSISDGTYEKTGSGPMLTINLEMGLGNLDLISE